MRSFCLYIAIICMGTLISCGDDSTDPGNPQVGANGFVLDGGGYAKTAVSLTDSTGIVQYDTTNTLTTYTASGTAIFGKSVSGAEQSIGVTITVAGNASGTSPWNNLTTGAGGYGLTLRIDSAIYVAVQGTTTVTSYGAVGDMVTGTFSGTVKDIATGTVLTITDGTFSAKRIPDKVQNGGTTPHGRFTIDGDGFTSQTILIDSDGSTASWRSAGYLDLLLALDNGAITMEFPKNVPTLELWDSSAHSKITIRISDGNGEKHYVGTDGRTALKSYGSTIFSPVTGIFSGTVVNSETGATATITGGSFSAVRIN